MGVSGAIFESAGKRTEHYVPGVYTRSHNVTSANGVSAGNLCILGTANGGEPGKLLEFGTLAEAKAALVSGDLLEAVGYAFNGSDAYIPQRVYAMRVNKGVRSEVTLKSGLTETLKLKSWDYGAHTNQLKIFVESGTEEGSKRFSVIYKGDQYNSDNIIKKSLSVTYYGEGSAASITVNSDSIVLAETVEGEQKTIQVEFSAFDTVGAVAAKINDSDSFSAVVLNGYDDDKSTELDTVSGVNLLDVQDGYVLCSSFSAFVSELMSCPYIGSVEILSDDVRTMPDDSDSFQYFTGGSNGGGGTVQEWVDALEILEKEDVQIIATSTTDSSIHAMIAEHCASMSNTVNRKERTCILGAPLGESDDAAIEKAIGFNSKYVSYVVDSARTNNPLTGAVETIPGSMVAVMLAGMEAAMSVGEPLTNKAMKVLGFSVNRTITQMEKLIKKGVLVCNPNPQNMAEYVVIRALTTFQGNGDLISCERSMVREDLYMNRDLRSKFNVSIGSRNSISPATVRQTLLDAARNWAKNGYIVPSDANENVWNISIRVTGDKIYLQFSRYLTAPLNFIFATATNNVYTSTVEI